MNRSTPQDIWRSEAFAEDLSDDAFPARSRHTRFPLLGSTLLCAVPVVVALLGGLVAFFHTMG